jgi:hypothetical protein
MELAQKYYSEKTLKQNSVDEKNEQPESAHLTTNDIKSLLE